MATTSEGLIALLKRKNVIPTGNGAKDIELAKSVMPKPFKKESPNDR
tara:strand:+ start:634 stop:774 length:141 start_codon:yes stop_codon:yes gene_type:complete